MQNISFEIISPREWSYIVGAINAIVWIIIFVYFRIKRSQWGLTHTILLLYMAISILSLHLFIYYPFSERMFKDMTLFPYAYLFVMLMLPLYPIIKVESKPVYSIQKPHMLLFRFVCFGIIILSLYHIDEMFVDIKEGIFTLFTDSDAGLLAYQKGAAKFTTDTSSGDISKGVDYLSVLANIARTIIPIFWLYYFSLEKKSKPFFLIMTVCMILSPLNSIASGSRYGIVVFMLEITTFFLYIKNFLSKKRQAFAKKTSSVALIMLLVPFFLVTISRSHGNMKDALYGIERYFSESFIHFNNHGLDANGIRNGDRTMTFFKLLAGLDTAKNYPERLYRYRYMTINESVFISYVGDFTLDFGPIISFVIFILWLFFSGGN